MVSCFCGAGVVGARVGVLLSLEGMHRFTCSWGVFSENKSGERAQQGTGIMRLTGEGGLSVEGALMRAVVRGRTLNYFLIRKVTFFCSAHGCYF